MRDLERLLAAKEIAVTCGSGGVGKTTTAAALGVMMALRTDSRVLVLTVDPARRLATALGLETVGNRATRIAPEVFAEAGLEPRGELHVAMLDTKQGWDDLINRHAPNDRVRQQILGNSIYASISGRFVQSHDYIAAEKLYDLHSSGDYDLIVIDTPPSRHALDILDAPAHMAEFFGSRLLRWLTVPSRNRVLTVASKPFYQIADRILGSQFLGDIVEFFSLLQQMEAGFLERATAVDALLTDRRTTFVVVSTLESAPLAEAEYFIEALAQRKLHLGALVLNKVLPGQLAKPAMGKAATEMRRKASTLAGELLAQVTTTSAPKGAGRSGDAVEKVLLAVADNGVNMQAAARREAELRAELSVSPEVTVAVPHLESDITDLRSLSDLGHRLWR